MTIVLKDLFLSLPCRIPHDMEVASSLSFSRNEALVFLATARDRLIKQLHADADEMAQRISTLFEQEIVKLKLERGVGGRFLSVDAEEWLLERGSYLLVKKMISNPKAVAAWNRIGVVFPEHITGKVSRILAEEMASKARGDDVVSKALFSLFEEANTLVCIEISLEQAEWICSSPSVVDALKSAGVLIPEKISSDTVLAFMRKIKEKTSLPAGKDRNADRLRKEMDLLMKAKYEEKARIDGTDI